MKEKVKFPIESKSSSKTCLLTRTLIGKRPTKSMKVVLKLKLKLRRKSEISMKRNNKGIRMQEEQVKEEMIEDTTMIVEEILKDEERMVKLSKGKQEEHNNTEGEILKVVLVEKVPKSPEIMIGITEEMVNVSLLKKLKLKLLKLLMPPFLKFLKRILKHMKAPRNLQNLESQKMMTMMQVRKRRLMILSSFQI